MEPDIIVLDKNALNPAFDMILGVNTLRKYGAIVNFAEEIITIDNHEVIMRPLNSFNSLKHVGVSTKYPAGYLTA